MVRQPDSQCAAICGLFCGGCPMYPDKCHGCLSDFVHERCFHCAHHGFWDCAAAHNVARCYECSEFPCQRVQSFKAEPVVEGLSYHAHVIEDSVRMREIGVGEWIYEQTAKHMDPKSGELKSWWEANADSGA